VSEWVGLKSDFLWDLGFLCNEHKDRQEGLFFKLVVLDKRLNVLGKNYKIPSLPLHDFCMVNFAVLF